MNETDRSFPLLIHSSDDTTAVMRADDGPIKQNFDLVMKNDYPLFWGEICDIFIKTCMTVMKNDYPLFWGEICDIFIKTSMT
jgi:hypothetical protein